MANFKILKYVLLLIASLAICSIFCKKDDQRNNPDNPKYPNLEEGINLTIFAFNNGIKYKKEFTLVDENSAFSLKSWIDDLNQDDGTALFYAIDGALDEIKHTNVPANFNGAFLVTFTDGLDNASVGFNSKYENRAQYQAAIKNRISNENFHDFKVDAYGIGVPSPDIGNQSAEFDKAIGDISSRVENKFVLSDFSEVQAIFAKIASSITTYNSTTDITFKISYGGTDEICLVFDGLDHNASQCKIQATVNSDKSFSNIQYTGLTSSSGSTVQGVEPDGALYHYTFTNVKKTDGTILDNYEIKNVKLYRSILGWGIDTEFNPASATNTAVTKKTAAIALVLDISSSLGSNLSSVKFAAKSFIDNLVSPSDYYTVTYSANGGTGTTPNAQTVQKGSMITLASGDGLEKTNSSFDGWNTKTDGTGTNYNAGSSYTVNSNVTLYAKWTGPPTVTTDSVSNITAFSATCGGNVIADGGANVTVCGVCWSTNPNPTISSNKTVDGSGIGNFISNITELTPSTTYYVRAYATNEKGTAYGEERSFVTDNLSNTWTRKADFAGGGRRSAVGFSIGNKGYIGTGWDGSGYKQDFWEYDPSSNNWTQKANFAGGVRWYPVGFSIGNKGYIGTGDNGDGYVKQDFWEYDPVSNSWTQKADFAGGSRIWAVGFSIGNKGYIGTGSGNGYTRDFWEYDPFSDTWTQKANFAGGNRYNAVGFSIGNKGYIGTGSGDGVTQDFWEYDPSSNTWTRKGGVPGMERSGAVGFSIGNKGYIGTGSGNGYGRDFWEYDPSSNTWTVKADFAGESRYSAVGFSIGNKGYIGTGSAFKQDFWEFTP